MNDYPSNVKEKLNFIISDMANPHWLFANRPGHDFMRQNHGKLSFYDTIPDIPALYRSLKVLAQLIN